MLLLVEMKKRAWGCRENGPTTRSMGDQDTLFVRTRSSSCWPDVGTCTSSRSHYRQHVEGRGGGGGRVVEVVVYRWVARLWLLELQEVYRKVTIVAFPWPAPRPHQPYVDAQHAAVLVRLREVVVHSSQCLQSSPTPPDASSMINVGEPAPEASSLLDVPYLPFVQPRRGQCQG
jgi:hypothetical protein